jgi:hypothetical protein
MGRHSDYEDFVEAMYDERDEYHNDYYDYEYLPYDYYLIEDDNEESLKVLNNFYWIKLVQRHWKKKFNNNKKYKGMLYIYKL